MTEIIGGNYPIDYDANNDVSNLITNKCQGFDKQWKENYSFHPAVCAMTWEQREEMKKFAWFIFENAVDGFMEMRDTVDYFVQDTANEAYFAGLADAKQKFVGEARKKIADVVDKL